MSKAGALVVLECACALLLAGLPATAGAYESGNYAAQHVGELTEQLDRGGAADLPDVPCGSGCQERWAREQAASPKSKLRSALIRARQSARLLPSPGLAKYSIVLKSAGLVGAATTLAKWTIGGRAPMTLYFEVATVNDNHGTTFSNFSLLPRKAGQNLDSSDLLPMSEDGFALTAWRGSTRPPLRSRC